ncbi:hypothetical protein [Kineococcus rhizosphaerae]|uniref:DUF4352 domain-containing protein n=1 Tax=Kineococcus rhizosphaerae TaxID=559628 RepID=A0A2T0RA74_9ACTN|nr:hypothetical protein [Kineococcus rhizosphaerae]PRY18065.1 hypothetical protein CLV37_101309 [Kineococcus rhizosphaerae]
MQDPAGDGASAGEYAYGQSTVLGDYTVSVDGVTLRGDVVVADLTVTYAGPGAGDAYEDLHSYLYDADGYSHDATDCDEPLSPDAADLPDLAHGRSESFQVCFTGVDDATGAWVEVDNDLTGDHAGWTDEVTLAGASRTDV